MILTLKKLSTNGKSALYSGAKYVIRFPIKVFTFGSALECFDVPDGVFMPAPVKVKKVRLTAAERAEARKNRPKLTLAEKIAKKEAALRKLKEAAAAEEVVEL